MNIIVLQPPTPAEKAVSNAWQTLLHLDMCRSYCNAEKWSLANRALVAAQASLQHVNQELIDDPIILKRLLIGFKKMRNRTYFKI